MSEVALVARLILAAVFSLAAVAKIFDWERSREAMTEFGLPAGLARPAASLLPLAELAVAAALVPATSAGLGAAGSLSLLVVFSGAVVVNLARGNTPDCHCFGQVHSSPIGSSTLVRNAVLGGLSVLVMAEPGRSAGTSVEWFGDLRGAEQAGVAVALVVFGLLATLGWVVVNLLRQQGRLLLRLDELEAMVTDRSEYPGLPLGSVAPSFALVAAVSGQTLTLEALLAAGHPVMLLFIDPDCGPCRKLMPDIARWQREYRDELTVAVVTGGDPVAARAKAEEHRLGELLVQEHREVAEAYRTTATPSAVLVGPDQRILSPVVAGGDDIRKLLLRAPETVARMLARDGLDLGDEDGGPEIEPYKELEIGKR